MKRWVMLLALPRGGWNMVSGATPEEVRGKASRTSGQHVFCTLPYEAEGERILDVSLPPETEAEVGYLFRATDV
jgi:hypothetical protein